MVAIVIFSDDGTAYCMGKSKGSVIDCVTAVTNSGQMDLKYVSDHEKRLKYISRASEAIEGEDK